eukprot:5706081-Prymnesium_polylepis.1
MPSTGASGSGEQWAAHEGAVKLQEPHLEAAPRSLCGRCRSARDGPQSAVPRADRQRQIPAGRRRG